MSVEPECESVEAFVEFCMDDERTSFTHVELGDIAYATHTSRCVVRAELESYGLTLEKREVVRRTRGFTTNRQWVENNASVS